MLSYGEDAFAIRPKFFYGQLIVAVEDDDDKHFWGIICKKGKVLDHVKLESHSGLQNVLKVLDKNPNSGYMIARDRDYDFEISESGCERSLLTYGHSIENTLCSRVLLLECIKHAVRDLDLDCEDSWRWLADSCQLLSELIFLNMEKSHAPPPLQSHPGPYLIEATARCDSICRDKVSNKLSELRFQRVNGRFKDFSAECNDDLWQLRMIPGHFLLALCRNHFHRLRGRPISESDLIERLFQCLDQKFEDLGPEKDYYKEQTDKVLVFLGRAESRTGRAPAKAGGRSSGESPLFGKG